MPSLPLPRYTDVEVLKMYLSTSRADSPSATVLTTMLAAAERVVGRYTRRYFAPNPPLRTDYQRQLIACAGQGQTNLLQLAGSFWLGYGGVEVQMTLPVTASLLQAALRTLPGLNSALCSGGPLPSYPISVYMVGVPPTTPQTLITADSTGLGTAGYVSIVDCGFDSNPPTTRRYTTRGKTENRVQDLRIVDPAADPSIPGSGGVVLYGRRLLPNQYYTEYNSYAPGGADETTGSGFDGGGNVPGMMLAPLAEPATRIVLGYGYGLGMTLAQQFAYVLPQMYLANDLQITGRWGWNPVPVDIVDTTYRLAARSYRERDASFSDQLLLPEGIALSFFKSLPASVKAALDTYRVPHLELMGSA